MFLLYLFVQFDKIFSLLCHYLKILIVPSVGLYTPVIKLNIVVFPAPFGPISPNKAFSGKFN